VPTISICTDEFVSIGTLEAGTLGMPRLPLAIIPHPLGGLKPGEVAERAEIAFREIVKNLEGK